MQIKLTTTKTCIMNCRISLLLLSFTLLFTALTSEAQKRKKADKVVIDHLSSHINHLSSEKMTSGARERMAMEYICSQFKKNGIAPHGDGGTYYKVTETPEGKELAGTSHLFINGEEIKQDGYFPLLISRDVALEAVPSLALKESGEPWFMDIKEELETHQDDSTFDVKKLILDRAKNAAAKGATALFVYNTSSIRDGLSFDPADGTTPMNIPVLYINQKIAAKHLSDETAMLEIKLKTSFTEKKRKSEYVLGYIDNNAPNTVVIGTEEDARFSGL